MISYLINVKSSMSFGEELYSCVVMWSFMSLFFVLLLHSYVKKKNQKLKIGRVLLFRFFYGLILFFVFGPAMPFIDFFTIWFTGMISPLAGVWMKLLGNPVYNATEGTNTPFVFLKCKKCNVNISEFDRVCPKCGEPTDNYEYMGKCKSCMTFFKVGEKFCSNCGHELVSPTSIILMNKIEDVTQEPTKNVAATIDTIPTVKNEVKYASKSDYNNNYSAMSEDALLKDFIQKELIKLNMSDLKKQIPTNAYRKKLVFNILFIILLFFFNVLIFFHFDNYIYIIYAIILLILFILSRKFDIYKYFMKEIKSRPNEKISNIILSTKNDLVRDKSIFILLGGFILCILIPAFYFKEPRIYYEKSENNDGYVVRFYTLGLTGNEKAVIPDTYNDKPVIEIRGNVFKNMYLLKEVELPDTITEIRGSTFKNDINLEKVKLPSNLERIGGSAFANCIKLKTIDIPDTVIEIGGKAFLNDKALESIILPSNLTEIRGNTFQNCESLKSINIPSKVTRIGGHAFHSCFNLVKVSIPENSKLTSIGSSAFRDCYNLREIQLPYATVVDQRAFKNSGTSITRFDAKLNVKVNEIIEKNQESVTQQNNEVIEKEKVEPVTKQGSIKITDYVANGVFLNDKVVFNKYGINLEYISLVNNIATLKISYNNDEKIVKYNKNISELYYAYDEYVFYISNDIKNSIKCIIYKMVPTNNEYKYFINYTFNSSTPIEFQSNNITSEIINIGNLEQNVNNTYSFNIQLYGDTNELVTFTNNNYEYIANDFMIVIKEYNEYSKSAVIYFN